MMRRLFVVLWLIAGTAAAQHGMQGSSAPGRDGTNSQRFAAAMDAGMTRMMRDMHAAGYTGDADIDFLAMMIPHHEGAVEMARLLLIHGRDPATRRLAEEIIAGQVIEIQGMKQRLAVLRDHARVEPQEFPSLGGTRGPAE